MAKETGDGEAKPLNEIIAERNERPVIADYTDDEGREAAHIEQREQREEVESRPPKRRERRQIEPGYVPLSEVLNERERRQRVEAENERYRQWVAEHNARLREQAEAESEAPDMFADPQGYNLWVQDSVRRHAQRLADERLGPLQEQLRDQQIKMSAMAAQSRLGLDKWKDLNEWIRALPKATFNELSAEPDPYAAAEVAWRQERVFRELGDDDLETWYEKRSKARAAEQRRAMAAAIMEDEDADDEEDDAPPARALPKSFAGRRSVDERGAGGSYAGPKPLAEIIRNKPRNRR